jgi:hypothetical protein
MVACLIRATVLTIGFALVFAAMLVVSALAVYLRATGVWPRPGY